MVAKLQGESSSHDGWESPTAPACYDHGLATCHLWIPRQLQSGVLLSQQPLVPQSRGFNLVAHSPGRRPRRMISGPPLPRLQKPLGHSLWAVGDQTVLCRSNETEVGILDLSLR